MLKREGKGVRSAGDPRGRHGYVLSDKEDEVNKRGVHTRTGSGR